MSNLGKISSFVLLLSVSAGACFAQTQPSGPSVLDPYAGMQVRDQAVNQEALQGALEAQNQLVSGLGQCEEVMQSGAGRIDTKLVTNLYIDSLNLQWYAKRLELMGEPAGHDFTQRREYLQNRLYQVFGAYKRVDGVTARLQRGINEVASTSRRNQRVLKTVQNLLRQEEYIEADDALRPALTEVLSRSIWYTVAPKGPGDVSQYTRPYGEARRAVQPEAEAMRMQANDEAIVALLGETTPDFDGLQGQLDAAAASLRSSGMVNDQSGPQWLVDFGQQWQQAQINAMRALGLSMARHSTNEREAPQTLNALIASQHQFNSGVIAGIAGLISADASQVTPAAALDLYRDYLNALAPLVALCRDSELLTSVQPALKQLADRSPALQGDVGMYRKATRDMLRWRERVAHSFTKGRYAEYPPLPKQFVAAAQRNDVPSEQRLFASAGQTDKLAMLIGPGNLVATAIGEPLRDSKASIGNLLNSRDGSAHATSSRQNSLYVRFPMLLDLTDAVADLKAALLVDEDSPPLTLEAAVALETAARGDLAAVGGTVTDVVIEGYSTRLANMSEADWGFLRLGAIPPPQDLRLTNLQFLPYVTVRAVLDPQWWRHKYFYVRL